MSGDPQTSAPIESTDDLVAYFGSGEKPRDRFRIGTEHEKIGVYVDDLARVPYEGERGIGALLERIAALDDWKPVLEAGRPIALLKDGASITLEPGGQIELSGAPLGRIRDTCREFNSHVELVNRASREMGIAWLAVGVDPLHTVDDAPRMPKARYDIMRAYLPSRGSLALDMMHATATVQANFDYESESDMVERMRVALACTPVVSAIFANSPLSGGAESGFVSKRLEVWRHMDPDRCGLMPFVFDPDFGYRRYMEWALDVPMFFVVRDHRYLPAEGATFRAFLERGFDGLRPTLADWDLHLTTLFPEVRLKRIIEVRGADAVPADLICALPAIWKGLLYDAQAGEAAWKLLGSKSHADRDAALADVARRGLAASFGGRAVLDLARDLASIASEGLARIALRGETDADERSFLDPVHEVLARGASPGEVLLEAWRGEWKGSPRRLIDYARY